MIQSDCERPVMLAALATAMVPFSALVWFVPVMDNLWVLSGIAALGWLVAWWASRLAGGRLCRVAASAVEQERQALHRSQAAGKDDKIGADLGPVVTGSKRLILLTEEHQQRASSTTSTAAKATEGAMAIAGAIEEMRTAIQEIGRQADQASSTVETGVAKVKGAHQSVETLNDRMKSIGSVVEMIRMVADRTNLLALNATIEAARAGEHGRGFAVVAQEVKNLANQTAEATSQIESQIAEVSIASQDAQKQMQDVETAIHRINEVTGGVKNALTQQTEATREIAHSADTMKSATDGVTTGISHLLVTTEEIRRVCEDLGNVSQDIVTRHAVDR